MNYKNIIFKVDRGIGYVTINRPKSLNSLNSEVLSELETVFKAINDDENVKVAIITGEGRAFVAGADISEMVDLTGIEGQKMMKKGARVMNLIESLDKPVIAAINGFALGGGCELAMACDIRVASENAQFGQPEVNLGIIPGFGGTQRLPRLVGKGMGKLMIMTADYIGAEDAKKLGLVEKVVLQENLMYECEEIARKIMTKAPIAIKAAKLSINNGIMLDLETAIALEGEACGAPFSSKDRVEGMKAFLEKRKAEFNNK